MKHTLTALVAALALNGAGCATNTYTIAYPPVAVAGHDGKYDSIDDYVDREDIDKIKDANYMVISESKYENPKGEIETLHSLGTAVLHSDVGRRTYLVTANHVVQNEPELFDFFGNKYKLLSEKFYLLDDHDVDVLHLALRKAVEAQEHKQFYAEDSSGTKRVLSHIVETSDEFASIIKVMKPRKVKTNAHNEEKDLAIISVRKLPHQPLVYSLGKVKELQVQNIVYVVGWPRGILKNVTQGHITSVNYSKLLREDAETALIFDASVSPGNSGGGIFAVRDGKFELVGITSAVFLGANDVNIGVKIDSVSEVFKGGSISCSKGWECNLSSPYELKLGK